MIVALIKLTRSRLAKRSKAMPGEKNLESKYRQLQWFARFSPRLYCVSWQLYGQAGNCMGKAKWSA
jgi:hypothetical protein